MEPLTSSTFALPSSSSGETVPSAAAVPAGLPQRRIRRQLRAKPIILGSACAVIVLAFIGVFGLYTYIAWVLAHPSVAPLQSNPYDAVQLYYEDVIFTTPSGEHQLEGWYIPADTPSPSTRTIVFSHGYGGNREEIWVPIYELARFAHDAGYNTIMFDYGYVYHEDRVVTGGARESDDLLGAVQYAIDRGAEKVIVWGFSMGAGTALQAALRTDNIDAMILDSTFVLDPDTLYFNLKQYAPKLPREPSLTLLGMLYPLLNGTGLSDVPADKIKTAAYDIPIFMIHGTRDERSPYELIQNIALNQTSHEASSFWLVPNATHELIYRAGKEEYLGRAAAFLVKAL